MELGIGEMSQINLIIAKTCFSYIGLYIFYRFSENGGGGKMHGIMAKFNGNFCNIVNACIY